MADTTSSTTASSATADTTLSVTAPASEDLGLFTGNCIVCKGNVTFPVSFMGYKEVPTANPTKTTTRYKVEGLCPNAYTSKKGVTKQHRISIFVKQGDLEEVSEEEPKEIKEAKEAKEGDQTTQEAPPATPAQADFLPTTN